tara:strand:+ start:2832 stop:3689 length:858 start_codon:yes stop_codon:yes gene_type:complete
MRTWSYFLVYFLCLVISSVSGIAKANEQLEESLSESREEIITIQKELDSISLELSNLQNIFVYGNESVLSESENLDIFLKLNQLENRLSGAIGYLEQIENKLVTVTKSLILRISEINELLRKISKEDISSNEINQLYDEVQESKFSPINEANNLSEDQKEYLSIKAIFDDGNYVLAIEEFTSFIMRFESSKLTLRAKFLRGESNLRIENWSLAAEDFLDTFSSQPNGPLSPYALFGLVLSLSELGEIEQSCAALFEIKRRHPEKFNQFKDQLKLSKKSLSCNEYD